MIDILIALACLIAAIALLGVAIVAALGFTYGALSLWRAIKDTWANRNEPRTDW